MLAKFEDISSSTFQPSPTSNTTSWIL